MTRIFRLQTTLTIALLATLSMPMHANADFIFSSEPMSVTPAEMVGYGNPSLTNMGATVEGITNMSDTIIELSSNDMPMEQLVTVPGMPGMGGGPPRVTAQDGSFSSIVIDAQDSGDFFSNMVFNVARVMGAPNPTFTLTVFDQFGNAFVSDFADDVLNPGPNFFSVSATSGSLIDRAVLTASSADIRDVRQLGVTVVPEPNTIAILSAAFGATLLRRRNLNR